MKRKDDAATRRASPFFIKQNYLWKMKKEKRVGRGSTFAYGFSALIAIMGPTCHDFVTLSHALIVIRIFILFFANRDCKTADLNTDFQFFG